MAFLKKLGRITLWIVGGVFIFFFIPIGFQGIFPAGLDTMSSLQAGALLHGAATTVDLPNQVTITLNGNTATFRKGTHSYEDLVNILHNSRSDEAFAQAGKIPSSRRALCGEMCMTNYGITSHFKFQCSPENPNYFWLGLPKTTSIGTGFPLLAVNNKLLELVKKNRNP